MNVVAAAAPNFTEYADPRFVPVIVTGVPPVVGPDDGATDATVGAANVVVLRLTVIDPLWLSTVTMSGRPSLFMSPAPMVVDAPLMIDFV